MRTKKYLLMLEKDDEANRRMQIIHHFFQAKITITRKMNSIKLKNFFQLRYHQDFTIEANGLKYIVRFDEKKGLFYSICHYYDEENNKPINIFTVREINTIIGLEKEK